MKKLDVCPVCSSHKIKFSSVQHDKRKGLDGKWSLDECNECSCAFLNPMPNENDLNEYYGAYYKNSLSDDFPVNNRKDSLIYKVARKAYHKLSGDIDPRDFVGVKAGDYLLDYGCGYGTYLQDFKEMGVNVYGTDLSDNAVKECVKNGFNVKLIDDISKVPYQDNKFDSIYAMQVLEHLTMPHDLLEEIKRVTKKDSNIYLAFPNYSSIWRRVFKKNWVSGWFAPFHVIHYNVKSVTALLSQHDLMVSDVLSKTPESWMRLNIKAVLSKDMYAEKNISFIDNGIIKLLLLVLLRILEIAPFQKDCLLIKVKRA